MSFLTIKDYIDWSKDSQSIKAHFESHCDWCWHHGFGNCDSCRKEFNRRWRPIRIAELTAKYKAGEQE